VFNFLGSVSAGYSTAEPTVMLRVILCIFILNGTMVIGRYVFVRLCYRVIFIFVELQHILSALGEERAGVPYFSPDTVHVRFHCSACVSQNASVLMVVSFKVQVICPPALAACLWRAQCALRRVLHPTTSHQIVVEQKCSSLHVAL